jgi:ubiquinone/menaquinone biosynthesis C-methylase UbiE
MPAAQTGPDPQARLARLFDSLADTYDDVGVDFFGPIARGLLEELSPSPGERVADLGCGKGAFLLPAARAAGPNGSAVGIDAAPGMVAAARRAAEAAGLAVELHVGDVQSPDLPVESFDVVAASLVLFFLPDPAGALEHWRALLAPGGRLGVSTFGEQDAAWRQLDDVLTPYLPSDMRDARTTGRRGPFSSDEGMEDLVRGAGFTAVRTVGHEQEVRLRDEQQWYDFTCSTGQRAMWEAIPESVRPDVRAEAARRLLGATHPDGGFVLRQHVRYTLGERPNP